MKRKRLLRSLLAMAAFLISLTPIQAQYQCTLFGIQCGNDASSPCQGGCICILQYLCVDPNFGGITEFDQLVCCQYA
jgi:hypothetical protein